MLVEVLAVVLALGGGALFLLSVSPIGRALAERIRGRPPAATDTGAHADLHADMQELHREVAELVERMDFVERLVAKSRDAERLAPPRP